MDMLSYMIFMEDNAMQYYLAYAFDHALFSDHIYMETSISELYKRMTEEQKELFLQACAKRNQGTQKIYISYDSTNMNTSSLGIEMAEFGAAKDDPEIPQVNVGLAYDQDDLIPLFYELYPGSIVDDAQCAIMIDRAESYGFKNVGFILDRGYFSEKNIKWLDDKGYDFIIMAKGNARFVQEAIEEVKMKLRLSVKYYISEHKAYRTTIKKKLYKGDKKERYFHIYYDEMRAVCSIIFFAVLLCVRILFLTI